MFRQFRTTNTTPSTPVGRKSTATSAATPPAQPATWDTPDSGEGRGLWYSRGASGGGSSGDAVPLMLQPHSGGRLARSRTPGSVRGWRGGRSRTRRTRAVRAFAGGAGSGASRRRRSERGHHHARRFRGIGEVERVGRRVRALRAWVNLENRGQVKRQSTRSRDGSPGALSDWPPSLVAMFVLASLSLSSSWRSDDDIWTCPDFCSVPISVPSEIPR